MKAITASDVKMGTELVERDGAVLTVTKIDTDPTARSYFLFECKSLNQSGIVARIRANRSVMVMA